MLHTQKKFSSNYLALLGLQEVTRCCWLDVEGLGLLSMLSVRTRQSARDGRLWRVAVRSMLPRHLFEVNARVSRWDCSWCCDYFHCHLLLVELACVLFVAQRLFYPSSNLVFACLLM